MIEISVIICTHNPRKDYLSKVLDGLRVQSLPKNQWELIVVDNASDIAVSQIHDLGWHPNSKVIVESKPGLTTARLRGGSESEGKLLLFVDDDNILAKDYLEVALEIGFNMPNLGTWGGISRGIYESPPPSWFAKHEGWIGVRHFEKSLWSNDPMHGTSTPIGAGMVVRRTVFKNYQSCLEIDNLRKSLDRCGSNLMSGGDIDIVFTGCTQGLGKGVFTQLSLDHLIPNGRTQLG
jgi:glycosyltransferase involved in cell wall biosynthesis